MNGLFITAGGLLTIAAIVWWFWLSKAKSQSLSTSGPIEIIVDGGVYNPARIEISAGKQTILRFIRKDPNPCAEKVIFDKLGVSAELELGKPHEIKLIAKQPGEYEFTCQMGMYRGMLIAK